MVYSKLASMIKNDIDSGLRGMHSTMSLTMEQIEEEIVNTRMAIIKEYQLKGLTPINDLLYAINCIKVDCKDIERCSKCLGDFEGTPTMHFEIPQLMLDFGITPIAYIGSIDRQLPFKYYTSVSHWNMYHKYRKRGKNKPYVYIDLAPNENNMLDCFVFNAPFLEMVSVVAVWKDPRQLENYGCCEVDMERENMSWINNEIQRRIVQSKVQLYRQLQAPIIPNTQAPAAG